MRPRAGLRQFLTAVVGGDDVSRPKPHPDGILRAAERLGVPADRCLYTGDAPTDLEAARNSGAIGAAAAWGHLYDPAAPAQLRIGQPGDVLALLS